MPKFEVKWTEYHRAIIEAEDEGFAEIEAIEGDYDSYYGAELQESVKQVPDETPMTLPPIKFAERKEE